MSNFYQELINEYCNLTFPIEYESLCKIGGPVSWYFADSNNAFISTYNMNINVLEIDIRKAYPTICNAIFDKNHEFIQQLNTIEDKTQRNIFIATTLKGEPLKTINNICKMIVVGLIYDVASASEYDSLSILELKKDGAVITCNDETFHRLNYISDSQTPFTKLLNDYNFVFHINKFDYYMRSHRTSFIMQDKQLELKGTYKHIPTKLKDILQEIILNNEYDTQLLRKIYSTKYFKIIRKNSLIDLLKSYYICPNDKVINAYGKYEKFKLNTIINPNLYLKLFVFPIIASTRI